MHLLHCVKHLLWCMMAFQNIVPLLLPWPSFSLPCNMRRNGMADSMSSATWRFTKHFVRNRVYILFQNLRWQRTGEIIGLWKQKENRWQQRLEKDVHYLLSSRKRYWLSQQNDWKPPSCWEICQFFAPFHLSKLKGCANLKVFPPGK